MKRNLRSPNVLHAYCSCLKLSLVILLLCGLFNTAHATNYYWVGGGYPGTQDVSAVSNWATTSGGGVHPGVAPGQGDDVFFDANSFTALNHVVTANALALNVRSMDWTGAAFSPSFTATQTVTVYGSFTLAAGMTFTITGNVLNFTSPAGAPALTINTNAVSVNTNGMTFNGSATWTLQNPFTAPGGITLTAGTLNTNNMAVTTKNIISNGSGAGATLLLGSSLVSLTQINTAAANFTFNAGTSTITITTLSGSSFGLTSKAGNMYNNVILNNGAVPGLIMPFTGPGNFVSVTANTAATFTGANVIGTLSLAAAKYTMGAAAANTTTITGTLITASAACTLPTQLFAAATGTQALINFPTGTVVNNFILQGINALSGSPTANASVDNGSNAGWAAINTSATNTLYWIGHSGNYSTGSNWSTSSGGGPAGCIPTANTDVFFDNNSFIAGSATVTLDGNNFCRNMTWAGSAVPPVLNGNSQTLSIYGSLVLQAGMTEIGSIATVNFNSFGTSPGSLIPQSITSNGVILTPAGNIRFAGYANWTIVDAFAATNAIVALAYGTLNTNSQAVSIGSFGGEALSAVTFPASLILGSSIVTNNQANNGNPASGAFSTNFTNMALNAGTSTIKASILLTGVFGINGKAGDAFYNIQFDHNFLGNINTNGTFNKITYTAQGGIIAGTNTIGTLILASGNNYIFQSGATQFITTAFTGLNASCASTLTVISSNLPPAQATLNIANTVNGTGIADLAGSLVTGINKTGTGTLNATGSVDNGSNSSNITFSGGSTNDLYWVGGSGPWNDATHWSLTSGGTYPSSMVCLPLSSNTVHFDDNSFSGPGQTVTLDNTAYAYDMIWSGITAGKLPVFANPTGKTLNLYGSLQLMPGMTSTGSFPLNYRTLNTNPVPPWPTQTINTNGVSFQENATFNGYANWDLQSAFNGGTTNVNLGTLNTNGFNYTASNFSVNNATVNAGSSTFIVSGSTFDVDAAAAVFNGTNAMITMTGGAGLGPNVNLKAGQTVATINFTGNIANTLTLGGATVGAANFLGNSSSTLNGGGGTITDAVFKSNTAINQTTNFTNLSLTAGTTNIFEQGKTQNVTGTLSVNGNPCNQTILQSSTGGTQAVLNYTGTPKLIGYAALKDISFLPTGPTGAMTADNNSNNNGNNGNITFQSGGSQIIGLGAPALSLNCNLYPYTINTALFFPSSAATFDWGDGSHLSTLTVAGPGSYSVTVHYNAGPAPCNIPDVQVLSLTAPLATNSGTTAVLLNDPTAPLVTFTGSGGTAPYTFTYNINGGANQTVSSVGPSSTATVAQATNVLGTFNYNLVSVSDVDGAGCTPPTSVAAIYVVTVLPVSLTSFSAKKEDGTALLNWTTAQELNSSYFAIEKSADGNTWSQIGRVAAAGNSSTPRNYSYADSNPFAGINYYRLRQMDLDGSPSYSSIRQLHFDNNTSVTIKPNPVTDKLYVTNVTAGTQLRLFSADGKMLAEYTALSGNESIDMRRYSGGLYILQVKEKTGKLLRNYKVVKQ